MSTIEALRHALAPVEELRGEQSLLASWLGESLAGLEALHGELTDWQRDLARQQASLDQREAAAADAHDEQTRQAVEAVEQQLDEARAAWQQSELENVEQGDAVRRLEQELAASKMELRLALHRAEELATALNAAQEEAAQERRQWNAELRDLRKTLEMAVQPRLAVKAAARRAGSSGDKANCTEEVDQRLPPDD